MNLIFHIIIQSPPPGIDYGLQKGSGAKYETLQIQRSGTGDLHFDCPAEIKGSQQSNELPDFKGPFVQGTVGDRFIYIDMGTYAGQAYGAWWRLKIPLVGISWKSIAGLNEGKQVLQAQFAGTARNGGPACATVKPLEAWKSVTR